VLTDADPAQLSDISFLDQLAATAIRITLGEGERKVQDIKMAGAQTALFRLNHDRHHH
jgi:hypothetical protein